MEPEWLKALRTVKLDMVEEQIDIIKQRIKNDQYALIVLNILLRAFEARDKCSKVSKEKADEIINEAIKSVNGYMPARTNGEGGIV